MANRSDMAERTLHSLLCTMDCVKLSEIILITLKPDWIHLIFWERILILISWALSRKASGTIFKTSLVRSSRESNPWLPVHGANTPPLSYRCCQSNVCYQPGKFVSYLLASRPLPYRCTPRAACRSFWYLFFINQPRTCFCIMMPHARNLSARSFSRYATYREVH